MSDPRILSLALVAGMAAGPALVSYAGWIIRVRKPERDGDFQAAARMAASLLCGLGWLAAALAGTSAVDTVNLGLIVSAGIVLTLVDASTRIIPNELVAGLLCLEAAIAVLDKGIAALPGRVVGFCVALTLLLVAMLLAKSMIGGGDVKLAAAVGFAAGFPNVLMAMLLMALAAGVTGAVGIRMKRMGRHTPMPYAGFLMGGLALTLLLDRAGALGFLAW